MATNLNLFRFFFFRWSWRLGPHFKTLMAWLWLYVLAGHQESGMYVLDDEPLILTLFCCWYVDMIITFCFVIFLHGYAVIKRRNWLGILALIIQVTQLYKWWISVILTLKFPYGFWNWCLWKTCALKITLNM